MHNKKPYQAKINRSVKSHTHADAHTRNPQAPEEEGVDGRIGSPQPRAVEGLGPCAW